MSGESKQNHGRGLVSRKLGQPHVPTPTPVIILLAVPRWLFCFGSLVILDVVCYHLLFFLLYITTRIEIGKKEMLNVRLAGKIAFQLAVAGDDFDCVFQRCLFSHEMFRMKSGTKLRQFLRVFKISY